VQRRVEGVAEVTGWRNGVMESGVMMAMVAPVFLNIHAVFGPEFFELLEALVVIVCFVNAVALLL